MIRPIGMYEENEDEIIESMASEIISSDLQDKNNISIGNVYSI